MPFLTNISITTRGRCCTGGKSIFETLKFKQLAPQNFDMASLFKPFLALHHWHIFRSEDLYIIRTSILRGTIFLDSISSSQILQIKRSFHGCCGDISKSQNYTCLMKGL